MTEEGTFKIFNDYDLNLYWAPSVSDDDLNKKSLSFTVTNEDKYVYRLFSELYDSFVNFQPFKYSRYNRDEDVVDKLEYPIVKNSNIDWHSDGFSYDAASILNINKDEKNNYVVTFNKSKMVSDNISNFETFAVQFSSGISRYDPYNVTFIEMYNQLRDYDLFPNNVYYKFGIRGKRKVRKR